MLQLSSHVMILTCCLTNLLVVYIYIYVYIYTYIHVCYVFLNTNTCSTYVAAHLRGVEHLSRSMFGTYRCTLVGQPCDPADAPSSPKKWTSSGLGYWVLGLGVSSCTHKTDKGVDVVFDGSCKTSWKSFSRASKALDLGALGAQGRQLRRILQGLN